MALGALDSALTGLRVSQQQLSVISNNIANVGTEGYTRKILPQSTQVIEGRTAGVISDPIIRKVDITLTQDVWTQVSSTSYLDTTVNYLQSIEDFHGAPDAEVSFAAEIADLRDSFSALADSPDDSFLLRSTIDQATTTASKINDFADLLTELRNDAQSDIAASVERINSLLDTIAQLNQDIAFQINIGSSPAQLQDFRDEAIKDLSEEIEISFFIRGDGVLVVQTPQGQELAAETSTDLVFSAVQLGPVSYYPDGGASGLFLRGDPSNTPGGVDLTPLELGGRVGSLLELRDEILPQYTAQIDEIAHKMALRFEAQGLRLFTDASGTVPPDTPPILDDPLTMNIDEGVPVNYVGFASVIEVNEAIINDNSLLRTGTYGASVQTGSNEVIRRVLDYTFGDIEYQEAIGNISFAPADVGGLTLQEYLGVYSSNTFTGATDLTSYTDTADIVATADTLLDDPNDIFRINFSDPDLGISVDLDIDLSLVAAQPPTGNFASDLVTYINTIAIPALTAADQADLATMDVNVQVGVSGQLEFLSRGDITVSADPGTVPNGMGDAGLVFLGFSDGATSEATDPYFDILVGNDAPTRISIDRNDTEVDLLAKLQSVENLAVYDFIADPDGLGGGIRLRPGNSFSTPDFGGDLRIIGGPFETDGTGTAQGLIDDTDADGIEDTLNTLPADVNIITALFGSINDTDGAAGVTAQEISAINDIPYLSETFDGSGVFVPFRDANLGPNNTDTTDLGNSLTLIDFGQKIITKQTQDLIIAENRFADEDSFRETLELQLLNESGVNLDEELSNSIIVQTAYSAAARAVNAVDELFRELLDSFR